METPKNKKLKITIIILAILLAVSVTALGATLLYNYFVHTEPATVEVPGNIITPEGENSTYTSQNEPSADPSGDTSQTPSDETADPQLAETSTPDSVSNTPSPSKTTEASSVSSTKASAISLHNKQSGENTPFQVTNMFPGDSETKYFRIKVYYKGDIIVRYHADIRPGHEKLAEVLKVRVKLPETDETLYDGLMRDMPQSLNHALYTSVKTQSELYYEITAYLDTSVGNDYQDRDLIADFRWWVEEIEHLDPPQTGDNSHIFLWSCLAVGSFIVMIILLAKRRKEAADEVRQQHDL